MPAPEPRLTVDDVASHLQAMFAPDPDRRVGIELEWLVCSAGDRTRRPLLREVEAVREAIDALPREGRVTVEPGGQLELSTLPFLSAAEACEAAADDLFVLDRTCANHGLELIALGADPLREPERVVTAPRYRAMQAHFDARSSAGVTMMCNTAAVQVNVGSGRTEARVADRWRIANALGPTLIAAFANSPIALGRPSGWASSRLRAWWGIDPTRTRPVPATGDPAASWSAYALDANVMLIREVGIAPDGPAEQGPAAEEADYTPVDEPFSFRQWLESGHELGWPTTEDLEYHLTTLFPPVRPRGWLELRMIDALPTPFWHVAVAVTAALLDDADAGREAELAVSGTEQLWIDAAQLGLGHPRLRAAADRVFGVAIGALERSDADDATVNVVGTYRDRWVRRGRCPADDRLDQWRASGRVYPRAESPLPYAEFEEAWT